MKHLQSKRINILLIGFGSLLLLFFLSSCNGSGPSPKDFHVGNFKYADHARFGDFVLVRTEDSQIDSGTATQLVVKFDLEWNTDEEYTLRFNHIISNPQNISLPDMNGMFRKCRITEVTDTSYIEVSTSSLAPDTLVTMIVKN